MRVIIARRLLAGDAMSASRHPVRAPGPPGRGRAWTGQRALNALTRDDGQALERAARRLARGSRGRRRCWSRRAGGAPSAPAATSRRLHGVLTAGRGGAAARVLPRRVPPQLARPAPIPKPYIALLDGITMGGGVGISVHGSLPRGHRAHAVRHAGDRRSASSPTSARTWFLPRCPGEIGMYLGLTGARLGAADCLYAGIGTHPCRCGPARGARAGARRGRPGRATPSPRSTACSTALAHGSGAGRSCPVCAHGSIAAMVSPTLEEVLEALRRRPSGWGAAQLEQLRTKSPTSLAVTFAQLRHRRHARSRMRPCASSTGWSTACWRGMISTRASARC